MGDADSSTTAGPPASTPADSFVEPAQGILQHPRPVVGTATLVMAAFVLWGLGSRSLWLDEAFTVMHSRLPFEDFWHIVTTREANAALHSVLMHGWVDVSQDEWWMRLPSAAAVIAAVPLTYLLGRRLFGPEVGAVAAVLLTANGFVVEYGQEGRGYALLIFLSVASGLCYVRFLQEPRRGTWLAWVLVSCLLGYAHFFGVLVVAGQVVGLLARRRLPTPWRWAWGGVAAIALAHLPIALFLLTGGDKGQSEGLPDFSPVRFFGVFVRVSGNFSVPLTLLVAVPCLLAALQLWHHRRRPIDERTWGVALLVTSVALPIGLAAVVALTRPLFVARFFVEVIPSLAVLTAFGLTLVRVRWAQLALGAAIIVLGVGGVVSWHTKPAREDARGVVAVLAQDGPDGVEPGDRIIFAPWFSRIPIEIYLEDDPSLVEDLVPVYPSSGWGAWEPDDNPGALDEDVVGDVGDADRVWVVTRSGDDGPDPELATTGDALVEAGFTPVLDESLDGLVLRRYER